MGRKAPPDNDLTTSFVSEAGKTWGMLLAVPMCSSCSFVRALISVTTSRCTPAATKYVSCCKPDTTPPEREKYPAFKCCRLVRAALTGREANGGNSMVLTPVPAADITGA
jgi:hypothetical protein